MYVRDNCKKFVYASTKAKIEWSEVIAGMIAIILRIIDSLKRPRVFSLVSVIQQTLKSNHVIDEASCFVGHRCCSLGEQG